MRTPLLLVVLTISFLFHWKLLSPPLLAQEPQAELALPLTFTDSRLTWAPCPPALPQGCEIAALHGDPAKDDADIFLRVPANLTIPKHWHTSAERIVAVSGEFHLTLEGQKPAILKPGSYIHVSAKHPHTGFCAQGAPCVLFIAFKLPVDAVPAPELAH